eukprot:1160037-Pelagomonas_calceolata.AAC.9
MHRQLCDCGIHSRSSCSAHRKTPNEVATPQKLAELGVLYWKLDADKYKDDYQQDPKLMAIRKARNYSFTVGVVATWRFACPFHNVNESTSTLRAVLPL